MNFHSTSVAHKSPMSTISSESNYLQPFGSVTNGIEAFSEFSAHQWSARKVVARPRLLCTLPLLLTNHLGCFGVARLVGDVGQNVRISALSCAEAMKRVLCHGSCTSMIPTDDRIGLYVPCRFSLWCILLVELYSKLYYDAFHCNVLHFIVSCVYHTQCIGFPCDTLSCIPRCLMRPRYCGRDTRSGSSSWTHAATHCFITNTNIQIYKKQRCTITHCFRRKYTNLCAVYCSAMSCNAIEWRAQ